MHLISLEDQLEGGILLDRGPQGRIILAVQTENGHLMALMTPAEAYQTAQSLLTLVMSQRESIGLPGPVPPSYGLEASPEGGGRSS